LNCINSEDLQRVFNDIFTILKPGGRFIGVIMPRYCLWEVIFFSYKLRWKRIFQRAKKGPVDVNLADERVMTWYYSPHQIRKTGKGYKIIKIQPIGIVIPPSFLEKFFRNKKKLLNTLDSMESFLEYFPFLSSVSDHFLFDLERRN
jgi:hypothetical protein